MTITSSIAFTDRILSHQVCFSGFASVTTSRVQISGLPLPPPVQNSCGQPQIIASAHIVSHSGRDFYIHA